MLIHLWESHVAVWKGGGSPGRAEHLKFWCRSLALLTTQQAYIAFCAFPDIIFGLESEALDAE